MRNDSGANKVPQECFWSPVTALSIITDKVGCYWGWLTRFTTIWMSGGHDSLLALNFSGTETHSFEPQRSKRWEKKVKLQVYCNSSGIVWRLSSPLQQCLDSLNRTTSSKGDLIHPTICSSVFHLPPFSGESGLGYIITAGQFPLHYGHWTDRGQVIGDGQKQALSSVFSQTQEAAEEW